MSDATVAALEQRAVANRRSVEAEHRALLEETLEAERVRQVALFRTEITALHESQKGRVFTPSAVLIREMRDES